MDHFVHVILPVQVVIWQPRNFVFTVNSYNGEILAINFIIGLYVVQEMFSQLNGSISFINIR
jgi:hypothetical protein